MQAADPEPQARQVPKWRGPRDFLILPTLLSGIGGLVGSCIFPVVFVLIWGAPVNVNRRAHSDLADAVVAIAAIFAIGGLAWLPLGMLLRLGDTERARREPFGLLYLTFERLLLISFLVGALALGLLEYVHLFRPA